MFEKSYLDSPKMTLDSIAASLATLANGQTNAAARVPGELLLKAVSRLADAAKAIADKP